MADSFADRLRTRRGVALISLIVAVVAIGIYLPTLRYQFVWEDNLLIVNNALLTRSEVKDIFCRGFWAGAPDELENDAAVPYYRPISTLSFWLDQKIAGTRPWYFHLINVILSAGCAVLVVLVVWELLHSAVWAGIAGLLFATHPAHVESVALVSARSDLLTTLFLGFATFALLRSLRKRNWRWWLVIPFCYALALLSKESAILFPLLVVWTPFLIQNRFPRRFGLVVGILFLIVFGYLSLRHQIFNQALPLPTDIANVRFLNIANTFGLYIRMFLLPFEHRVKIPPDPAFLKLTPLLLYTMLFVLVTPLAAMRRRFRVALLGYFWGILFLLPVSNIYPIGPQAAERLLFLPSFGMVVLVISLISRLLVAQHAVRQVVGFGLVALAGLFAWNVVSRLSVWRDERALFSAMIKEAPQVPAAYVGLGRALQNEMPDSAITLYKRAVLLDQGFVPAHINIALLYSEKGDHRRAIHHLRLANELNPDSPQILTNLGFAFFYGGQFDSALVAFHRAQVLDSALFRANLGAGLALWVTGESVAAGREFSRLQQNLPGWKDSVRQIVTRRAQITSSAEELSRLGRALYLIGDSVGAEVMYRRVQVDEIQRP
ncbi:phospholipid carrier-dependent glycosyltransferase [candidate division WOR-3 bacterium]|nr:phospholipid carrier-dependent glycosyltransferase [candidate division WOR-3 bacterium]